MTEANGFFRIVAPRFPDRYLGTFDPEKVARFVENVYREGTDVTVWFGEPGSNDDMKPVWVFDWSTHRFENAKEGVNGNGAL